MRRRLFVVSDLHLGGSRDSVSAIGEAILGSALFTSGPAFSEFVRWITAEYNKNHDELTELVINGDIFDFLCELGPIPAGAAADWFANEQLAMDIAETIGREFGAADGPLAALRDFVARGGELTLLIGNHDVELSYPRVRAWLKTQLESPGRKVNFIYDGEAYAVADVLIEHGNRYDPWNVIDHDAMRRDRAVMSRQRLSGRLEEPQFHPPAGSHMVVFVLNALKRQYRFVDLLKPETELVLPLLVTVCPPVIGVIRALASTAPTIHAELGSTRGLESGSPEHLGYLSASDSGDKPAAEALAQLLGSEAHLFSAELAELSGSTVHGLSASEWTKEAARQAREMFAQIQRGWAFITLLAPGSRQQTLSRLQAALRVFNRSDPFSLEQESDLYLDPARRLVAAGYNVVIFGHTHLPKHVRLGATAEYVNTGTWADVLRIPSAALADDSGGRQALEEFAQDLADNNYTKYAFRRLTYAEVEIPETGPSRVALLEYKGKDDPRGVLAETAQ